MLEAMSEKIVHAMFETLPVEITIIDAEDKVVGWNKHDTRLFYRPMASMEMNFRECHPKESLPLVEKIVDDLRQGRKDKVRFWIDMTVDREKGIKHKIMIEFFALRDEMGKYLGCMECTMDIEEAMHLTGEKRLIDEA